MGTKKYFDIIIRELQHVRETVSEKDCEQLLSAIYSSERVFCYGLGRAGFSMKAFAMRLMHFGKEVYFLNETVTPGFGRDDLLIVSSASGETAQLVALAKKARELKGTVAVLTTEPDSSITQFCDVVVAINAPSKNHQHSQFQSEQPMSSLYEQALLMIGDALIMQAVEESDEPEEWLLKRHANLE